MDSRAQRIADLPVGGTETVSVFVPYASATADALTSTKAGMSARLRRAVAQGGAKSGKVYATCTGEHITDMHGGGVIVTATALCIGDGTA